MHFNNNGIIQSAVLLSVLLLVACGGGVGGGGATNTYSVGGTLTGLATGNNITLTNNATDSLTLTADGAFNFALKLNNAAAYSLTLSTTTPTTQPCTSTYGVGTVNAANVTSLNVICGLFSTGGFVPSVGNSLTTPRDYATATLLPNGKVLITGGFGSGGYRASSELYNQATGTWTATGSLATGRYYHTATLLSDGKVLVVGGAGTGGGGGGELASAELYDPATSTWTATGSLATARYSHTATLLPNGKVLVSGGYSAASGTATALASAELYDPTTGAWSATGSLTTARVYHTATMLPNGKVLVAGGYDAANVRLASAELFDPATSAWTATGSMSAARIWFTATLLPNGKVLVVGGGNTTADQASAELYDPANGTWAATGSLATGRYYHTATLLPSGKLLVIGGMGAGYLASAELYDPSTGAWSATGPLAKERTFHMATLLADGRVLVAGGSFTSGNPTDELYEPTTGSWSATGSLVTGRAYHSATLLTNGKVLVTGGYNLGHFVLSSAELYDPATGMWTATGSMTTGRYAHTATLLPNGKVLVSGGYGAGMVILASAELYDPATGSWTATSSLATARFNQTATLLSNGKVLVCGGAADVATSVALASTELYDPATGNWTATGLLAKARFSHTATLLPNGKVLVSAGTASMPGTGMRSNGTAELYDPATGAWATTGSLVTEHTNHTATLLPNGKVLVFGGSGINSGSELYDQATGVWTPTGLLVSTHTSHTATLLPNGKVLAAGGIDYSSGNFSVRSERYDPDTLYFGVPGVWSAAGSLTVGRYGHTATLLHNGKVLVVGGMGNMELGSAELYF
jgi:N-acetylneuraminic acid mutarotase